MVLANAGRCCPRIAPGDLRLAKERKSLTLLLRPMGACRVEMDHDDRGSLDPKNLFM